MISTVNITVPPIGLGYQVVGYSTYITDSTGIIVEPQEYVIVESPTINPPNWYVPQEPPPPLEVSIQYIPQQVTMRQARLALLDAGLLNLVTSAIDLLEEPQKTKVQIEWEYSAIVERNSPLVQQMSLSLGLTEQQLDALFIQANTY